MLIDRIKIRNFRQFSQFQIDCRKSNILVGPNNSGKSTCVDCIRLCADIFRLTRRTNPQLREQADGNIRASYTLGHNSLAFPIENVVRNYGDEPACISVRSSTGAELEVELHPDRQVNVYLKTDRAPPRTARAFQQALGFEFIILPRLGPLEKSERYLQDETVRRNENTRLAAQNFRNILIRKNAEDFDAFRTLIRDTWDGVDIEPPHQEFGEHPTISMMYLERRIPREVFWAGFGFQIWMQIILQIMRVTENSIFVLDEPDIYLHPDLQHKLYQLARRRCGQLFIATHSSEIINEASAGEVLTIDSSRRRARRINSDEGYRDVFNYIGSSENAEFARLSRARRIVFFEGNDKRIIRKFAKKLPDTNLFESADTIFLKAGGFGQWAKVKNVNWTLDTIFGMEAKVAAIFDRDYRCSEQIEEFLENINSPNLLCHVLKKKEIENYAISRETLHRYITRECARREIDTREVPIDEIVADTLSEFEVQTRNQIFSNYTDFHKERRPGVSTATILNEAEARFMPEWSTFEGKLSLIPGKEFLSVLSAKLQRDFNISISASRLVDEMRREEVDNDLAEIIRSIEAFFSVPR